MCRSMFLRSQKSALQKAASASVTSPRTRARLPSRVSLRALLGCVTFREALAEELATARGARAGHGKLAGLAAALERRRARGAVSWQARSPVPWVPPGPRVSGLRRPVRQERWLRPRGQRRFSSRSRPRRLRRALPRRRCRRRSWRSARRGNDEASEVRRRNADESPLRSSEFRALLASDPSASARSAGEAARDDEPAAVGARRGAARALVPRGRRLPPFRATREPSDPRLPRAGPGALGSASGAAVPWLDVWNGAQTNTEKHAHHRHRNVSGCSRPRLANSVARCQSRGGFGATKL